MNSPLEKCFACRMNSFWREEMYGFSDYIYVSEKCLINAQKRAF
jgi:hypothetical protein